MKTILIASVVLFSTVFAIDAAFAKETNNGIVDLIPQTATFDVMPDASASSSQKTDRIHRADGELKSAKPLLYGHISHAVQVR